MNQTDELQQQQNEDEARIERTRMKGPQSLPAGGNQRIVEDMRRRLIRALLHPTARGQKTFGTPLLLKMEDKLGVAPPHATLVDALKHAGDMAVVNCWSCAGPTVEAIEQRRGSSSIERNGTG